MSRPDRILVVDDNPVNRKLLSAGLRKAGYELREAADGVEAAAAAREWLPDLVLLDVSMPVRDGFEVCAELKCDALTAAIPILFLTALTSAEDIERAFAVGGSDYITKPFHLGEVKARVSVHLQLRDARRQLETAHTELLQAQKLESIGQLAAGIAHEINTPAQYIGDNTRFLRDAFADLAGVIGAARALAAAVRAGVGVQAAEATLERASKDADLDYLESEIPRAFEQSLDGLQRVARIVGAMKEFSHPGRQELESFDLNRAIGNTVVVARGEWKYVADLETDLDPELPAVPCIPGEIGQVILNLLVNAAHAVGDVVGASGDKGRIVITTRRDGDMAELRVTDTGTGIPPNARERIFEPFFTTKEVGKGTGQGLAIAHAVVVRKHGGTIDFETETGRGTTFVVRLPLARPRTGIDDAEGGPLAADQAIAA